MIVLCIKIVNILNENKKVSPLIFRFFVSYSRKFKKIKCNAYYRPFFFYDYLNISTGGATFNRYK